MIDWLKGWLYEIRTTVLYPLCSKFGHQWEEKEISVLGYKCSAECKRCKCFIYRADNTVD